MSKRITTKLVRSIIKEVNNIMPDISIIQVRATNNDQGLNYVFLTNKIEDDFVNLNLGLVLSRIQKNILTRHNIYFSFKFFELDTPIFSDLLVHEYPNVLFNSFEKDSPEKNVYFTY